MKKQTVSRETKFAHVRAHSHMCDVRVKSTLYCLCDVRACGVFFWTCDVRSHFRTLFEAKMAQNIFFIVKFQNFLVGYLYSYIFDGILTSKLLDGVLHCQNQKIEKLKNNSKINENLKRAGACALEFWSKRTRACDVRAAEN